LSMTTVVIIVLAMTMLILGLTLVRTIFSGATNNVNTINDKVRGEINKLFTEENQKIVLYLPENTAKIKQGESFGIAVGIKNIQSTPLKMDYTVSLGELGDCPKTMNPMLWVLIGKTGTSTVQSGDTYTSIIRFQPPLTAPLCTARFKIDVQGYTSTEFDVQILSK